MGRFRSLALLLCLLVPATAGADDLDKRLAAYEAEARQLGTDLPQPNAQTPTQGQRKLVDAEVAYSLGDYDTAALMLFDLASKPGPDQEVATYYLGESLFQKGDRGAARGYYDQVVAKNNVASKYYQPSLLRLVEISISQNDTTGVEPYLTALDRLSPGLRLPLVPYVRGKFAFTQGKLDEALAYLQDVPKGSSHELQAAYYTATAHVAKKDLNRATDIFTDLINRKPRTANDRRVIELSQLALGRLYYERDQPSKSIDSYLLVDRRSDLFPDALYEVAWVYVKSKQFDKALRALELLHLSAPQSTKTPTVRILEGNLRVRKAQMIRQAQITGTLDATKDDPQSQYDKAKAVFAETHDAYFPSYEALRQMAESTGDPAQYLAQIAGRSSTVFQATAPIPEAAAQYLRDEPEVQRVVSVETDLNTIEHNITDAENTIARLEAVLGANDRTAVYPALQGRRARMGQIQDDLIKIRSELADQQLRLVDSPAELASLTSNRKALAAPYLAMPNAEQAYADRLAQTRTQYDGIDQGAADIDALIDSTQAVSVALRKYMVDAGSAGGQPIPADQKGTITETLDQVAKEAQAIEAELANIHREVQLGRDLAGVGDDGLAKARGARKAMKAALDAEHRALAGPAASARDKAAAQKLAALGDRAARIADNLAQTDAQIDGIVDRGFEQVRGAIAQERGNLAGYKDELAAYNAESRSIGGTVLGGSFKEVKAKFYDIVIRTDVGLVDVSWSQKEDNDDDFKRLNLSRTRDLKQLKDEFRDVLEPPNKTAPKKQDSLVPPQEGPAGGSPDKGATDTRVKPGGDQGVGPAAPVVRPGDTQPPAPPKGGR
ncbi:MAG: tetratricopeptide repeat protein [Deltaproteobacteria bacterium]|nr:tetratricopeptide repeat protein [Deltaproteobacteria bacterium]